MFTDERSEISLCDLPVEILHRIFDFLNAQTIVISLRSVCRQFNNIVKTYNRFQIHFRSIHKTHFYRLISEENVVRLDFLDRQSAIGWTQLFLKQMNFHHYTRLRCLSLQKIDRNDLQMVLRHVTSNCQLNSLEIHSDLPNNDDEIFELLSSMISQSNLENLHLQIDLTEKFGFVWPRKSSIKKLTIGICTISQLCSILSCSPFLQTIVMNNCHVNDVDANVFSLSFSQLTSLVFNDLRITMNKFEILLSLFPSLVHLDLTSTGKPFEFIRRLSQWENFLRYRLPQLSKFEFCIFCYGSNWKDFETLIEMFRTSFWIEEKRWFVTCQFRDDWTTSFTAFTSSESFNQSQSKQKQFDRIICSQTKTI